MIHKLAFLALLTALVIALHGCTRRNVPNTNGVVTLNDCLGKGMQFDANKRKCILPDDAFCYGQLMIKGMSTCMQPSSQDDCDQIARNNSDVSSLKYSNGRCSKPTNSTSTNDKRDTSIKISVNSRISGAIPKQHNAVVLADVALKTNNQDTYQLMVLNYPNSGCQVSSTRDPNEATGSKFIITGLPSARATSCNAKVMVINLVTGAYNTADIVANVAP